MHIASILSVAVGLSMDAMAVSISSGLTIGNWRWRDAIRIAGAFGLFQAVMPVIGWSLGLGFRDIIVNIDHWVAFILLAGIGGKMLHEAWTFRRKRSIGEPAVLKTDPRKTGVLLMLALATSIDAMVAGLSFCFLPDIVILYPAVIIGITTFILSLAGVYIGEKFGGVFQDGITALGGLILIGIGVRVLFVHMAAG